MNEKSSATVVDRREFVRSLAGAFFFAATGSVQQDSITLGILANNPVTGFDAGVRMGLSEASRAAALFGRKAMTIARAGNVKGLLEAGADAILGSAPYEDAVKIARECGSRHVIYMNCGARSQSFREQCSEFLFHIEAGEEMYANAAKAAPGSTIKLWDSSLEKYGAAQLNDRFRSAFKLPMDAGGWCGWFATKVIWESLIRMKGKGAPGIRDHLLADTTQFDGHKGAALSFRGSDHQLRQPLYVIVPSKPPRDIPDIARAEGSIRDLLDTIAGDAKPCRVNR